MVRRLDEWVRAVLAEDPAAGAFPSMSHPLVDALSSFVPDTDVVVTFVVFEDERKVRILSVQDIPS